jgi:hypothetical protein
MIEFLGKSISLRALIIARTFAFADSFKLQIKNTMAKVIDGANEYKAINRGKDHFPAIANNEENTEAFKKFLKKTFAKHPQVIELFADAQFNPAHLSVISQQPLDDPMWNNFGISSMLHRISVQSFAKTLREKECADVFLPLMKE